MQRNIPEVKVGIIAVSRDCFPIQLSERRRAAVAAACAARGLPVYEVPAAVENENDMLKAVAEAERAGCNALAVFLGNFGPETPETLIARHECHISYLTGSFLRILQFLRMDSPTG